jgi:hypothetical protein
MKDQTFVYFGTARLSLAFRLRISVFVCFLLFCTAPISVSQVIQPKDEAITGADLVTATRAVLAGVRETSYRHRGRIDPVTGVYQLDCSEFVSSLLERVAPLHYQQIPIESGRHQPRAAMYFEFFEKLEAAPETGWRSLNHLADVMPGDIIAWKVSPGGRGDTGHVMIVATSPQKDQDGAFQVRVYDSSEIRHEDDSRPAGTTGVGSGTILFKLNNRGSPIAFQFNRTAHWHYEPIAVARLEPIAR